MLRRGFPLYSLGYRPCLRDFSFLMEDVFGMYAHYEKLGYANLTRELLTGLIAEAGAVATTTLLPLDASGDAEGCQLLPDGGVRTPNGFEGAYKALCRGGWIGMSQPKGFGGGALPHSVGAVVREVMATANAPLITYIAQSVGAAEVLIAGASATKHEAHIRRLVTGEWCGALSLTEGGGNGESDGIMVAERIVDGTYKLRGSRDFILAGDHDLTANVLHVVLARAPSTQPAGTDVSLFLVPRHTESSDGKLAAERNVRCLGLGATVGMKGTCLCRMGFDNSVGYFVREFNTKVRGAATSTNSALITKAMQGVCHAERALQSVLLQARECGSSRAPEGSLPSEVRNNALVCSANVRLSILFAKAVSEGGRALSLDVSRLLDIYHMTRDAAAREAMENKINFYATIAETCLSRWSVEAASRCLQLLVPSSEVKGSGVEQTWRDASSAALYGCAKATNSVEFLNKHILPLHTEEVANFGRSVRELVRPYLFSRGLIGPCARRLWLLQKQWRLVIAKVKMLAMQEPESVGAVSEDVIMYAGYMVLAHQWLRMATVAHKFVDVGKDVDGFYQCKLDVCQYVFQFMVPYADAHFQIMQNGADAMKSSDTAWDLR